VYKGYTKQKTALDLLIEEMNDKEHKKVTRMKQPYETDSDAEDNDAHKSRVYGKQHRQAPVFTKATTLARMPVET